MLLPLKINILVTCTQAKLHEHTLDVNAEYFLFMKKKRLVVPFSLSFLQLFNHCTDLPRYQLPLRLGLFGTTQ